MADNPEGNEQQRIDNAINELIERKNDNSIDRPSTSTAQKRTSPSSDDSERSFKRLNSSTQNTSNGTNHDKIKSTNNKNDEHDDNTKTKNTNDDDNCAEEYRGLTDYELAIKFRQDLLDRDKVENIGENSRAIESISIVKPPFKRPQIKPNLTYFNDAFVDKFHTDWLAADTTTTTTATTTATTTSNTNNHIVKQIDDNTNVKLYSKPFKICLVQNFLNNKELTKRMVREMCQMEWQRKQMDLYEFHQTTDLANVSPISKPNLKKFYHMMNQDILPWMKQITGLPLTHISASCSMYNYGDYLLVHDDLLSDRQIAFVYYLTPWYEEWTEKMGGALELFECSEQTNQPKYPIVEKFPPRNDQFIFFRVCKQSFHQVGEVTNLVYPRLTINGWFHGPTPVEAELHHDDIHMIENEDENSSNVNIVHMHEPSNDEIILSEWIDAVYLKRRTKACIQQHIEDKSEASLESFLIQDFFDLLVTEFRENTELNWTLEGPANQQKYETLRFNAHSTGPPKDLYTLFTSKSMFGLLHEFTELDFDGPNAKTPTCSVQICRFTQGCYTLLGSQSTYADCALELILFFGAKDGVGKITYLSPSEDSHEFNLTADTDATGSTMDVSMDASISNSLGNNTSMNISLSSKSTTHVNWKRPWEPKAKKIASESTSKAMETSSDLSLNDSSSTNDPQDAEVKAIMNNICTISSSSSSSTKKETTSESFDSDSDIDDSFDCSTDSHDSSSNDDNETMADDEYDELAHEESLLTIHPKNNSLNLVYRLSGQTKFIKYISKNALKPDEYVYILMATYKE